MPPTRYTVVTTEDADNELLTIWLNNRAERGAITRASHRMDQDLRFDAELQFSANLVNRAPIAIALQFGAAPQPPSIGGIVR